MFTNPEIPDGINVSDRHPLRDFFTLSAAILALTAGLTAVVAFSAGWIAPLVVSFEAEQRLAAPYENRVEPGGAVEEYLQALAARLASAQRLPPEIRIRMHYADNPAVNAFATLGGNIVVFRGLIEASASENVLAMVVAHEIAHVRYRHPLSALGRGLAMGAMLTMVSATAGNSAANRVLGEAGLLTSLSFSRGQEEEADASALMALAGVYGHVAGAEDLFAMLEKETARARPPRLLSTHPMSEDRARNIVAQAAANGWSREGALTPLPEAVRAAIRTQRETQREKTGK